MNDTQLNTTILVSCVVPLSIFVAKLKRHCIEFGVVRIGSAIVVRRGAHTLGDNSAFVNSAGQLLLPGGVRPKWITSA